MYREVWMKHPQAARNVTVSLINISFSLKNANSEWGNYVKALKISRSVQHKASAFYWPGLEAMSYLYVQGWRLADEWRVASLTGGTGTRSPEVWDQPPVPVPGPGLLSLGHWWPGDRWPVLSLPRLLIGDQGPVSASDWLVVTQPPALGAPPRPGLGPLAANAPWSEIWAEMVWVLGGLSKLMTGVQWKGF